MSARTPLWIGTATWKHDRPEKIGIYNSNYGPSGCRTGDRISPWRVEYQGTPRGGYFRSHEAATTFVRELLEQAK